MGLKDRIRRLEEKPEAKRCPECRHKPEGASYIVVEDGEEGEQEHCPQCGRSLYFFIRVVYES